MEEPTTPAAESAADKEKRQAAALRAFIEPENKEIAGVTLRPVSLGSLTLLKLTGNEFLAPQGPPKMNAASGKEEATMGNELFAALSFAYIHAAPLAEVRRVAWIDSVFREKVLEWGEQVTAEMLPGLLAEIERSLGAISALEFAVQPKPDEAGGPTPPPN